MTSKLKYKERLRQFQKMICAYYQAHKRLLPWREDIDPYRVVVSEIMLQQTQVDRVIPKFEQFVHTFPSFQALAHVSVREVLVAWQGLGYNRRALYVHAFAQRVVHEYNGILPDEPDILDTFAGIGEATAASIVTFAYNKPTVFIETNIRSVFIHFFYATKKRVFDAQLIPLIEETVDQNNPREWYYALMDYGTFLKKQILNPSRKSAHYAKQSPFAGSDRQIRGALVRTLVNKKGLSLTRLSTVLNSSKIRVHKQLEALVNEGFVVKKGSTYSLME